VINSNLGRIPQSDGLTVQWPEDYYKCWAYVTCQGQQYNTRKGDMQCHSRQPVALKLPTENLSGGRNTNYDTGLSQN